MGIDRKEKNIKDQGRSRNNWSKKKKIKKTKGRKEGVGGQVR